MNVRPLIHFKPQSPSNLTESLHCCCSIKTGSGDQSAQGVQCGGRVAGGTHMSGSQLSAAGYAKIASGSGVRSKKSAGEGGNAKRFGGDREEGVVASTNGSGVTGGKGEVDSMVRLLCNKF